jgi:hypothetical protein
MTSGISDTRHSAIPSRDRSRLIDPVLTQHVMLPPSPNARCIPFGESMAIQIFSFSFRGRL